MRRLIYLISVSCACLPTPARGDAPLRDRAADGLRRAVKFFVSEVAVEGGYLWRYSEDLGTREGEGRASDTTVWVQPPGTPSVGMALLRAHWATGEQAYLDAARQAGMCLVRGQLRSGGWDYRIEFDPKARGRWAYRLDAAEGSKSPRNTSTLDDNTTQAALRLLMRLDKVLDFRDAAIHESAEFALAALLAAQYPNGAWPQRFEGPPDAEQFPVQKAGYPDDWPRTFSGKSYSHCYTLNDNAQADAIEVMFEAWHTYDDERYLDAARRGGDFLLLAQMPDPQPAWAQQYDAEMHPVWARKFEPPAVTGGESQGAMRALLNIYCQTGDKRYLEPIPRAIAYLQRSQLPDGRLARFYELKTNRPLYFTTDYQLTYRDDDLPTHYAFIVGSGLDGIGRQYERLSATDPAELSPPAPPNSLSRGRPSSGQIARVEKILAALDDRGRWVEEGRLKYHGSDDPTREVIDCRTFVHNVETLSDYLATVDE
jgi:hypothetical protein